MKAWIITGIFVHLVFAGAYVFEWSIAVVIVLCQLGIGLVMLLVPEAHPNDGRPEWIRRVIKRIK